MGNDDRKLPSLSVVFITMSLAGLIYHKYLSVPHSAFWLDMSTLYLQKETVYIVSAIEGLHDVVRT